MPNKEAVNRPDPKDLDVTGSQIVEGEVVKPPKLNRPDLNAYPFRPGHKKAKIDQRERNFTDKFEAALDEISQLGLLIDAMQSRFEPAEMLLIKGRLNMARTHIEYIWRESGLKK